MKQKLADYLGIEEDEILEFKQRGDAVVVINSQYQKLKVDAARLAAHGAVDADAPPTRSGDEPTEADDLTRIDGVGEATAAKLAAVGIASFAGLVAADSEQTAIDCALPLSKLRGWQVTAGVLNAEPE